MSEVTHVILPSTVDGENGRPVSVPVRDVRDYLDVILIRKMVRNTEFDTWAKKTFSGENL